MFGFGKNKENEALKNRGKALEGALEETLAELQRRKVLGQDTEEALSKLAVEQEKEAEEAKREAERLRELSTKDELTEILNRRGFLEEVKKLTSTIPTDGMEVRRHEGFQHLAVMIIDVDFFKHFNDTLGHDGGDTILKSVARHLAKNLKLRTTDIIARWGGEEFIIALPGASEQDVMHKLSELRKSMGEEGKTGIKFEEAVKRVMVLVTMSCGIASFRPGEDINETINRADKALYAAKRGGRDRAFIYDKSMIDLDPRPKQDEGK